MRFATTKETHVKYIQWDCTFAIWLNIRICIRILVLCMFLAQQLIKFHNSCSQNLCIWFPCDYSR